MANERRARRALLWLGLALVVLFLLSFSLGRYGVPPGQVVKILCARFWELFAEKGALKRTWAPEMETVVINIRLPRIVMACLVGCALSGAGTAFQGVFHNPMASPDILGASSGAAFGAALAILLGASSRMITLSAFGFGLLTVGLVMLVAHRAPGVRLINLILAGIMLSSLFNAGTSYIKLVADPSNQLPQITYWLMGSLSGTRLADVPLAFFPMVLGLVPLFLLRWQLNLLSLGEQEARALGVDTHRVRLVLLLSATLVTAASVSVSGMIGWVGLVVPHLCRKLLGSDHRYLMPGSFLCGAAFLLLVDDVSRNLLAVEIPIGILTALVGAPFFLYLITRKEEKSCV